MKIKYTKCFEGYKVLNKQEDALLGFGGIHRFWIWNCFKVTLNHSDLLYFCIQSTVYSISSSARFVRDIHLLVCEAFKEGTEKLR